MSWWDTEPHSGEYGGRTVAPPAWPQVDEDVVGQAAQKFETLVTCWPTVVCCGYRTRGECLDQVLLPGVGDAAR